MSGIIDNFLLAPNDLIDNQSTGSWRVCGKNECCIYNIVRNNPYSPSTQTKQGYMRHFRLAGLYNQVCDPTIDPYVYDENRYNAYRYGRYNGYNDYNGYNGYNGYIGYNGYNGYNNINGYNDIYGYNNVNDYNGYNGQYYFN